VKIEAFYALQYISRYMTYIDKIKEKINNVYPILPINGFLMVEEKREKENKVKVLMLNYA